jgi:hypothetical protein
VKRADTLNEQANTMRLDVASTLSTLVNWVQKDALPIWLERSRHVSEGWFSAYLSRSGLPLEGAPIQLAAQAQMLYLLAKAKRIGWVSGQRKTARQLIDFVGRHGTLPCRSDGYVRSLESPSVILDSRYDPVDHATFVIANTACFAAFGEMADLRRAYNILDWLHIHFAEGTAWKGIDRTHEAEPELYRYMLWAFLDLAEITQKPVWQQRAKALFDHCVARFDLSPAPQTSVSPAVFDWYERLTWVRVLCQCERVLGGGLTTAASFYRDALAPGRLPIVAGAEVKGEIRAEAIAAGLALLAAGVNGITDAAMVQLECFFRDYLVSDLPGVFTDEPWKAQESVGSLATLVRLFDAAGLAQQLLARSSHSE